VVCSQVHRGQLGAAVQAQGLQSGVQASAVLRRHRDRLRSVSQLRGDSRRGAVRIGPSAGQRVSLRGRRRPADRRGVDPAPSPLATCRQTQYIVHTDNISKDFR